MTKFNPQFWQNVQFGRGKVGLPHMGLTKIRKSGYGPDRRVKKTLVKPNTAKNKNWYTVNIKT